MLLCSRQSGKSTVVSFAALHEALYRPDSLILLLSPSLRQSGELFKKVIDAFASAGQEIQPKRETALTLEFHNGSRIVCLPGKEQTIRGYSGVRLLVIDEGAWVPDDLYNAVKPMLAVSGGRMLALSTPQGKRGWFYKEWTEGEGWYKVRIPAPECPRIPADFLESERRSMPDWVFRQEYMCEFSDTDNQAFPSALIDAAFSDEIEPLFS